MAYAVRTDGLGKRFGATEALADLSLCVEAGTVLGLLGHNGAGKTTAVRILTTLALPSEGRAFVVGHDVVREPARARASLSLAGQQASLDDRLTGRENLRLLGRLQKLGKADAFARADALLARFGIQHAADRQVGTYSWAGVFLRRLVRDPDGADGIAMTLIFPLMFLSGIFVPVAGLPTPLRQIAEINPLTSLATAVRELFGSATGPLPDVFTLSHPVLTSIGWAVALLAVFVPLAVRRYRRLTH